MKRSGLLGLGLLLVTVLTLVSASPAPDEAAKPAKLEPLSVRLHSLVKFPGVEDAKTTFGDVMGLLADRHSFNWTINEPAFLAEQVEDVRGKPVVEKAPLPAMESVRLDTVLRLVLQRVPSQTGATYLVHRDGIEITTQHAARAEVWGPTYQGPFLPLVNASFEKRPLEDALKDLAEASDFNIVLDTRAGEKARTAVSARFTNAPLDTAVRLLADMAELEPFAQDNVLYVTTRDNAARLEEKEKKELHEQRKGLQEETQTPSNDPMPRPRRGGSRGYGNPNQPPGGM
jgi:hypothetical protein